MEREFNLIHEPWILVRTPDCQIKAVSLRDALIHSQVYVGLAGELPTQDAAILRLLLAVLHAVFSRVDETGRPSAILEEDDALDRWEALWNMGGLPSKPLDDYFAKWEDRFWLFDDKYPFWQVPEASSGTAYGVAKLNGMLSESSNKVRLFPVRTAQAKMKMECGEAARWLLYVNGYDDTSAKPKGKGLPSPGAGWLGKVGSIYAKGNNLFETLMLNLVLLKDGAELWASDCVAGGINCPAWERSTPRAGERTEVPLPVHPCEMLTLQSRRLLLQKENGYVTGYTLLGGDFFPKENAVSEQMTIWSNRSDEKKGLTIWAPRRHDPGRQMWRDFSSFAVKNTAGRRPGVVSWVARLREENILSKTDTVLFVIAAVKYGDKDFFITDVWSDELTFHIDLLTEAGQVWNTLIENEINNCTIVAGFLAVLSISLKKAAGNSGDLSEDHIKAAFYSAIDAPFRQWLYSISPKQSPKERDLLVAQWRDTTDRIAKQMAQSMIDGISPAAFVGRTLKEKVNGKDIERHYSAPEAMNYFLYRMKQLYYPEVK